MLNKSHKTQTIHICYIKPHCVHGNSQVNDNINMYYVLWASCDGEELLNVNIILYMSQDINKMENICQPNRGKHKHSVNWPCKIWQAAISWNLSSSEQMCKILKMMVVIDSRLKVLRIVQRKGLVWTPLPPITPFLWMPAATVLNNGKPKKRV